MIRTIVRHKNRKLYDKTLSGYTTLGEIARNVKSGETVQVLDNQSKTDITKEVLSKAYSQLVLKNLVTSQELHDKIKLL